MSPENLNLILFTLLAAVYAPLTITLIRRREGQEVAAYLLTGYLVVGFALTMLDAMHFSRRWSSTLASAGDIQIHGALLLSTLMLLTTLVFTRRKIWTWLGIGVVWCLVVVTMIFNVFRIDDVIWTNNSLTLTREKLASALSTLGWLVFTVTAFTNIRSSYTQSRQPLLRNRLNYWTPVFLLIAINDILLIAARQLPGNPVRVVAATLAMLIVVTHDPPDLREMARRVLTYIITTFVIVMFYLAGATASQRLFTVLPGYNPLLVGAGIAILLSFIFTPLLTFVRRLVNRWFNLQEFHASRTLHAYSEQISNILDMQRLASMAVGLILDRMNVTRGFLFLVDKETKNETTSYQLRGVRSAGERQIKVISLSQDNPIVKQLLQDQRPLLQYDLDLLPVYRAVSQPDREWFNWLETEVYLPIISKREWIGLLAIGPKISGNRYTPDDLVTLSALANQTAVALENARLVDNLMQLNTELRQAYRNLDKANRDLEQLDRTKSDFISIASHELRTPLTTMIGYTELLLEDNTLTGEDHEMLTEISKGTKRLHEIMDSMFDLAQIDSRTLRLHLVPVDMIPLIKEVGTHLEKTLKDRQQSLTIDVSPVPKVKADPNLLEKLFQHLIANAIKFTPNNGRITVTTQALPPDADMVTGAVQVTVSDTGVGVAPDVRDIIFSKFYQPGDVHKHSTSKTRFKGSGAGLGLALSKGIVEAHGGYIWVESPGYDEVKFPGSQFHVVLPLGKEEPAEVTEAKLQI